MWYAIPHLWVKVTTYVVYYTTNVYSPEIPILYKDLKSKYTATLLTNKEAWFWIIMMVMVPPLLELYGSLSLGGINQLKEGERGLDADVKLQFFTRYK